MPTKEYKDLLLKQKLRILKSLGQLEETTENNLRGNASDTVGVPTHIAELGSDAVEKDLEINLTSSESNILQLIEEALKKIDLKKYGICENCNKSIPVKRLKAIPYTKYCIECQNKMEKKENFV
ncbi:MAG: TraR/DksA family transcriptional regulator [Candidatus Omnitrophica bacterium]|nr:TraR/DksA family transcriptional regulator [Candidatus Omnitrophota bacterium]